MSVDSPTKQLSGMKVLIAEDEPLVAMDHADRLRDAGAMIVGPCALVSEAVDAVERGGVDVAVIDYVLADGNSDPLQEALKRKQVPYLIVTAYPRVLVRRDDEQTIHTKPVTSETLCSAVKALSDQPRNEG